MKITDQDLRTDLPEIIETEGYANCVLALVKPDYYTRENTYIPAWNVVNTVYYCKNSDLYQGWVELQQILPPRSAR